MFGYTSLEKKQIKIVNCVKILQVTNTYCKVTICFYK